MSIKNEYFFVMTIKFKKKILNLINNNFRGEPKLDCMPNGGFYHDLELN